MNPQSTPLTRAYGSPLRVLVVDDEPNIAELLTMALRYQSMPEVPILFLTARDAIEDRVAGLTAGGDDRAPMIHTLRRAGYVLKPAS